MVRGAHPFTESDALCAGAPLPLLAFSEPSFSLRSSPEPASTIGSMEDLPLESSPVFLPPAAPETPVRHNLPKLMTTKLFYIPEQPVRRNLFGNHLHGCPYNDAHLLGMADHPTPPLSKRKSRLECNCAKLLEEGYDQMEVKQDNTVGAREMDGSTPLLGRGIVLDGKVCATLSWSSSPTKEVQDHDEEMFGTAVDEMEDEQRYTPTPPLSERSRSAAPSPYSGIWEGIILRSERYEDDEMNDAGVESNLEQESPDIYIDKLTLHMGPSSREATLTTDEDSERQEGSDLDDDCDTICDMEYGTEMETEPQTGYDHQDHHTEDCCTEYEDDDNGGGFFTFGRSQQPDLDSRTTLTALTAGPKKVLWYPAEPLS